MKKIGVLFVCMGNICRSPTAHGVFRQLIQDKKLQEQFIIDSAGTHAEIYHHVGDSPDSRSLDEAKKNNVDIGDLVSRQFIVSDFQAFDYIIVMDQHNYQAVCQLALNADDRKKVSLLTDYQLDKRDDHVPDPYMVGGFHYVYELINDSCVQLLEYILSNKEY